jgi:molecular chaperone Hsp33
MDTIHRFLFEDLDIRGALIQLGPIWNAMHAHRNYAPTVRDLLGELTAVTALLGSNLKSPGRISFQMQGQGAVSLLLVECDEQLRLRGMARYAPTDETCPETATGLTELLGDGQLVLTLQASADAQAYQSYVPLTGNSMATVFEHYLAQSEQQPARLWLVADAHNACGLFLQKLPEADLRDADGWNRIEQLAATLRSAELVLPPKTLLTRLFADETIRLFEPRDVTWHCPRDEEKVRDMLRSLGREEVEAMLAEGGQIAIEDEICGHEYRFGAEILNLFRTLH